MSSSSSTYSLKSSAHSLHVVAGAIFNSRGEVLIAQRPPGKHMAGGWEFPGGKLMDRESPYDGLVRELREELNISVLAALPLIAYEHRYSDRNVFLDLWHVTRYDGTPSSAEGQPIKWVNPIDLDKVGLLEADTPMIAPLRNLAKDSAQKIG